jgi:hypothetical protein
MVFLQAVDPSRPIHRTQQARTCPNASASSLPLDLDVEKPQVITVGGKTCGKPVGSTPVQYGDVVYAVIDFRAVNARGEGDFYAGLAPTCPAADDLTRELGDRKEASLAAVLHYIRFRQARRGGHCPGSRRPVVDGASAVEADAPRSPGRDRPWRTRGDRPCSGTGLSGSRGR